jgi:hypothetical protein
MTTHRSWPLAAAAFLLTSTAVFAAEADPLPTRFRIDLTPGVLAAGSDVSFTEDGVRRTADTSVGPAIRLGGGYKLTEHFDLSASAQGANTSGEFFGRRVGYTGITGGTRFYPLGRDTRVRPWLVGEAGWYHAHSRFDFVIGSVSERSADGGGLNVGTGFDVPIGRHFSVGFDTRWNQTLGLFNDPGYLTTNANLGFHFGS